MASQPRGSAGRIAPPVKPAVQGVWERRLLPYLDRYSRWLAPRLIAVGSVRIVTTYSSSA
jgi:hypothetical protein